MSDRSPKSDAERVAAAKLSAPSAKQLQRAKDAARQMDEMTSRLNETLQRVEKVFAGLHLGVSAQVTMSSEEDENGTWCQVLRFGKDGNEWRLSVAAGLVEDEDWTETPLLSASRATRAEALKHLPRLFDELIQATEKQVNELLCNLKSVENFLGPLVQEVAK